MSRLLTPAEMAEYLGVKESTIYQWTHQGYIPHVKLGRLVRFRLDKVVKWVEKKETNGRVKRKVEVRGLAGKNPAPIKGYSPRENYN